WPSSTDRWRESCRFRCAGWRTSGYCSRKPGQSTPDLRRLPRPEALRRPQLACRSHHVHQRRLGFWPGAGLQAAIGVYPQPLGGDALGSLLQQPDHLVRLGYPRRMDVVNSGPDVVGIVEGTEGLEQLHLGARRLDGDDVGIHRGNRLDHIVELAVAHVRVDLRFIAHAAGAQAEGIHRPVEIVLPGGAAQRQTLAEGRLVDLHDTDAGRFQIADFVANGQCQLPRLLFAGNILAREGPHEHGDRAGEHALYHLVGLLLGVTDPVHRHRRRTAEVAMDHRRLDAARTIALHPAEAGETVAFELLGEVFDHVVALRLAMHQHVQPQLLLNGDRTAYFRLHGLGVVACGQRALLECLARQADRRRLREGADGGGREQRELQARTLQLDPRGEARSPLAVPWLDRGQPRLDDGIMNAWRLRAAELHGAALLQRQQYLGIFRGLDGTRQGRDLGALLHGERQPALHFRIQLIFAREVDRAVQQRAGRRDPQTLAQALGGRPRHLQRLLQIAAPDVAAIDQAEGKDLVGRQTVENYRVLLRRAHQVDMQAVDRQRSGQPEVVLQAAEIGGDQLLQRRALEQVIGAFEGILPLLGQVHHQDNFVDLHPLDALCREAFEH